MDLPPHVDTERIMVNVSRLKFIHRAGAIAADLVMGYEGDVTETTPNIVGVNADGSAIAGKSGVTKKAEKSKTNLIDPYEVESAYDGPLADYNATFGRTALVHRLNKPELASEVSDLVQHDGKSSEAAWAQVLDGAVRSSMREGGRQHLLYRSTAFTKVLAGVTATNIAWFISGAVSLQPSAIDSFCGSVYMFAQMAPALKQRFMQRQGVDLERRLSIVPYDMQPDRYLAVDGLTRLPGLIKNRK
jgi:hypothetical protein